MADHGSAEGWIPPTPTPTPWHKIFAAMKTIFRTIFRTRWAAATNTILRLCKTFQEKRSVQEEKTPRAPNVQFPEAVEEQS